MLNNFIEQYGDLSDGIVSNIQYDYEKDGGCIQVTLKAHNHFKKAITKVDLKLSGVKSFFFKEDKSTNGVIFEAVLLNMENQFIIDFSPYSTHDYSMDDFYKSEFGIICSNFEFIVE